MPGQCRLSPQYGAGGYSSFLSFFFLPCISPVILVAFWKLYQLSGKDPYGCLGIGENMCNLQISDSCAYILEGLAPWAEGLRLCPERHWGAMEGSRDRLDLLFGKTPQVSMWRLDQKERLSPGVGGGWGREGESGHETLRRPEPWGEGGVLHTGTDLWVRTSEMGPGDLGRRGGQYGTWEV